MNSSLLYASSVDLPLSHLLSCLQPPRAIQRSAVQSQRRTPHLHPMGLVSGLIHQHRPHCQYRQPPLLKIIPKPHTPCPCSTWPSHVITRFTRHGLLLVGLTQVSLPRQPPHCQVSLPTGHPSAGQRSESTSPGRRRVVVLKILTLRYPPTFIHCLHRLKSCARLVLHCPFQAHILLWEVCMVVRCRTFQTTLRSVTP